MMHTIHFIRPLWFLAFIPLLILGIIWLRKKGIAEAWQKACDPNLLPHLLQGAHKYGGHFRAKCFLLLAASFIILALTGPSLEALPAPTYHTEHPRILLLDLSNDMLEKDIKPDRLTRAKFKLHDLFKKEAVQEGQLGLIVYTGEPFVVSPLTEDAGTIDALIHQLKPAIMPVGGLDLSLALKESTGLLSHTSSKDADILVITGTPPSHKAIQTAKKMHAKQQLTLSILPITADKNNSAFAEFAAAGGGLKLAFSHKDKDITEWLNFHKRADEASLTEHQSIPVWRDDGRYLILPALLCLLPLFRRSWLLRVFT